MAPRRALLFVLIAAVASLACSPRSSDATDPGPDRTDRAGQGAEENGAPRHAPAAAGGSDDGVSPWGNSVPDDDLSPDGCAAAGAYPGPSCATNSDCGICHDGSACGRSANRGEIERQGAACRRRDAADCEYAVARCCDGTCRITPE